MARGQGHTDTISVPHAVSPACDEPGGTTAPAKPPGASYPDDVSPRLARAVERCATPVSVECIRANGDRATWLVKGPDGFRWYTYRAEHATQAYLATVSQFFSAPSDASRGAALAASASS